MSSGTNLDSVVKKLINLVEVDEYTVDGDSIIATAFRQQGITTFEHLCSFPYYEESYGRFTYYKEKDDDGNTKISNNFLHS